MGRKFTFIKPLIVLLLFLVPRSSSASITFVSPFVGTSYCAGDSFLVGIHGSLVYAGINVFSVRLSNSSGSFISSVVIGTGADSTGNTVIHCGIPLSASTGSGYRIKVYSTIPLDSSLNNGYNITITNVPVPAIIPSAPIVCAGDSLKLIAIDSLGITYAWTGPSSFSSNLQNPAIPNVSAINAGTYTVVASLSGCTASQSAVVTVKPLPNKPVTGSNSPVCAGDSIILTAAGTSGASFNWTGPAAFTSGLQNPGRAGSTVAFSGNYIVVANLNGCTLADTIAVLVKPLPAATVIKDTPVCIGRPLHLNTPTVTGGSYNWTGPAGFVSGVQSPVIPNLNNTQTGLYFVKVTASGCSASDSTFITADTIPFVQSPVVSRNCPGDSLTIHTGSAATGTYFWSSSTGFSASTTTGDLVRPGATSAYDGTYYFYLKPTSGCTSDTGSVVVAVKPAPATPAIVTNSPVCAGHNLFLNASSATTGVSYSWNGPAGFSLANSSVLFPNATVPQSGQYRVTTILNGCASSASVNVLVNPALTPDVTISADPGTVVQMMTAVRFTAHALNAGDHPTYRWRRNDADIPGATDSVYNCIAGRDINENDKISVSIISNAPCAFPDTAVSYIFTMRVKDLSDIDVADSLLIYPNPSKGSFVIKGIVNTTDIVDIRILDIIGQVVYRDTVLPVNKHIYLPVDLSNLASAIYVVQVKAGDRTINKRVLVK